MLYLHYCILLYLCYYIYAILALLDATRARCCTLAASRYSLAASCHSFIPEGKMCSLLLRIACVCLLRSFVEAETSSCPNWFSFNNNTQQCECGWYEPWGIRCSQAEKKIEVADGFCVSYVHNQYYAGNCLYAHSGNYTDRVFSEAPRTPDGLDEYMCGYYNRKGLLCGECIDGYGPAVYSLEMKCVECSKFSTSTAIILHILLEFIPITLFFIFVLVLRLNITAGPLLGYVIFCQAYVFGVQTNTYIASHILSHSSGTVKFFMYSSLALCRVWLLKFAWIFTPPFCISDKFTNIHLQLFGLVRPIIPVIILIAICVMTELHKRDCAIIVFAWKLFKKVLNKVSLRHVDSSALIRTLASFMFLLSYNINFALVLTYTYNPVIMMDWTKEYRLFSDPTIIWFGHRSLLYLSILIVPFLFLAVTPSLLLLLYPTKLYRFVSQFINNRKQLAITAFAESLHSCFKDGLNGTRDYRALAGLSMIVCFLYPIICFGCYTLFFLLLSDGYTLPTFSGIFLFSLSLILSYLRPCKSLTANISLSYHVMVLGFLHVALSLWRKDLLVSTGTLEMIFIGAPLVSHLLVMGWAITLVVKKIILRLKYPLVVRPN